MIKKINAYIFTRPIQYANVKNIVSQKREETNILFVYPNFSEGYSFYKKIQEVEKEWDKVIYVDTRVKLFKELIRNNFNHLYLNTDLGYFSLAQFLSKKSFHYEEGWGTYNKGEQKKLPIKSKLLLLFYNLIGSGNHMGNSLKTNGVIIYNKKLHKFKFPEYKKEILNFPLDFNENIRKNLSFFEEVYGFKSKINKCLKKNILIYATGWRVDNKILKDIEVAKSNYDKIYIKLHPHIKQTDLKEGDFELLEQNVLLEIYISELINLGNKITVWHDNTSSVFYYLDKIEVKNIGRSRPEYNEIFNFIKTEI